jgi:hypothetical protein
MAVQMNFQIIGVVHCVFIIYKNMGLDALFVIVEIFELIILVHVKHTRESGENIHNIVLAELNLVYAGCYNGLEKISLGIQSEEEQIHNVMMMPMRIHHLHQIILALQDTIV